jgi:hypothetical protein
MEGALRSMDVAPDNRRGAAQAGEAKRLKASGRALPAYATAAPAPAARAVQ